jgi:hypothetical protein
MLKEYYVVSRYIASIPEGKDMTNFILSQVEEELSGITPGDWKSYLKHNFSVIEGDEVEIDEDEEEN